MPPPSRPCTGRWLLPDRLVRVGRLLVLPRRRRSVPGAYPVHYLRRRPPRSTFPPRDGSVSFSSRQRPRPTPRRSARMPQTKWRKHHWMVHQLASPACVRHSARLSLKGWRRAAAARAGPTWKMGRSWAQTLFSLHLATRVISRPPGDTPGLHLVSGKFLLKFFSRYSPCSPPPIPSLTPFFASFSQVQQHQSRRSSSRAGSRGGSNSRAGAAAAEPAAEVAATAEPAERRRRRLWRLWRADSLFFV